MERKKEKLSKHFSSEKYGMDRCPSCKGTGKSANGGEGARVCGQCGGFGWVKKKADQT